MRKFYAILAVLFACSVLFTFMLMFLLCGGPKGHNSPYYQSVLY